MASLIDTIEALVITIANSLPNRFHPAPKGAGAELVGFVIGTRLDSEHRGEPVTLATAELRSSCYIVGSSGAGKSTALQVLFDEEVSACL